MGVIQGNGYIKIMKDLFYFLEKTTNKNNYTPGLPRFVLCGCEQHYHAIQICKNA